MKHHCETIVERFMTNRDVHKNRNQKIELEPAVSKTNGIVWTISSFLVPTTWNYEYAIQF